MATTKSSITASLNRFRTTHSLGALVKLIGRIVWEGRVLELLYGAYCTLRHRPSEVVPPDDHRALTRILAQRSDFLPRAVMSRQQLLELYGDRVAVQALPEDFAVVRREAVWFEDGRLILGEYGEGARIACLTAQSCIMSDHYQRMAGFKHIHAIQKYGSSGKFLVSTGEARKVLDLWVHSDGKLRFERRLRRWLAGFTAAIEVDGVHYFGSDFSLRPNFIVTLDGAKYFFPQKAYKLHPSVFYSRFDRCLVSVNKQLDPSGGRRTLSVFDTKSRRFIFCDDLES